jgi:dUTP pyrophosphatase
MTATTESTSAAPAVSSPPAKRVKTDSNIMDAVPLQVKKLAPSAKLPTRGSAFAAGYDVYASKDTTVPARGKVLVDTDISIAVPAGTCEFQLVPNGQLGWSLTKF